MECPTKLKRKIMGRRGKHVKETLVSIESSLLLIRKD